MTPDINKILLNIKQKKPFILNISNYFPIDLIASGIRSLGAFPMISNAKQEIDELLGLSKAIIINLGKLDDDFIHLCQYVCASANKKMVPIILDPVGAGASNYRTDTALSLISTYKISTIRAYPNEISGLLHNKLTIPNYDLFDTSAVIESAKLFSKKYDTSVVVSGKRHIVLDSNKMSQFNFDSLLLQKVAGIGSLLSSIIGTFLAVEQDRFLAAELATHFYANCVGPASSIVSGPASLITELIDQMFKASTQATFVPIN